MIPTRTPDIPTVTVSSDIVCYASLVLASVSVTLGDVSLRGNCVACASRVCLPSVRPFLPPAIYSIES